MAAADGQETALICAKQITRQIKWQEESLRFVARFSTVSASRIFCVSFDWTMINHSFQPIFGQYRKILKVNYFVNIQITAGALLQPLRSKLSDVQNIYRIIIIYVA
jgi:hypothetical protein